jgi:hypothetical protein
MGGTGGANRERGDGPAGEGGISNLDELGDSDKSLDGTWEGVEHLVELVITGDTFSIEDFCKGTVEYSDDGTITFHANVRFVGASKTETPWDWTFSGHWVLENDILYLSGFKQQAAPLNSSFTKNNLEPLS